VAVVEKWKMLIHSKTVDAFIHGLEAGS